MHVPALEKIISDAIRDVQPISDSGIAVAIVKDNKIIWSDGFGLRDRRKFAKVDPETFFAIGSTTKAFTSMAACMFAEDGKLALNVPAKQYLSDFKMKDSQATSKMTLEEILTHRTGLPRHDAIWYLGPFSRSQLFYRLRYLDPIPGGYGNTFQYNNMMYMVAGYLLEVLAGTSWEQIIETRIFDPLGMSESNFSISALASRVNHAKGYEKDVELPIKDFTNIGPAAEINSNVLEMAKWLMLFLRRGLTSGGRQLIGQSYLEKMYNSYIPTGVGIGYGLGWFVGKIQNKRFVFHQGDADGFAAYASFMPDDGLAVVALTNQQCTTELIGKWPDKVVEKIYDYLLNGRVTDQIIVAGGLPRVDQFAPLQVGMTRLTTSSHPADYTGMFSDPGYGDASVSFSGRNLSISYYSYDWPLKQIRDDKFYFALRAFGTDYKVPVVFDRGGDGKIAGLSIPFQATVPAVRFVKR